MSNNNTHGERLTTETEGVGTVKHDIYAEGIDQYKKAMDNGFYIEAIALMESIIADRLESLANYLSNSKIYSYKPAGRLANALLGKMSAKLEPYPDVKTAITNIRTWLRQRNHAVHEMFKLSEENWKASFKESYSKLEAPAKEGCELFRDLDNAIRYMRIEEEKNSNKK